MRSNFETFIFWLEGLALKFTLDCNHAACTPSRRGRHRYKLTSSEPLIYFTLQAWPTWPCVNQRHFICLTNMNMTQYFATQFIGNRLITTTLARRHAPDERVSVTGSR